MQRGVEDQGAEVIPNDRSIIVRLEAGDEKWCAGCGCLGSRVLSGDVGCP